MEKGHPGKLTDIETTGTGGDRDDRELQTFGAVDGHDPDSARRFAQRHGCAGVGILPRQRSQIGDKAGKLAVPACLVVGSVAQKQAEVVFPRAAAGGAVHDLDKIGLVIDILDQSADRAYRALFTELRKKGEKAAVLFGKQAVPVRFLQKGAVQTPALSRKGQPCQIIAVKREDRRNKHRRKSGIPRGIVQKLKEGDHQRYLAGIKVAGGGTELRVDPRFPERFGVEAVESAHAPHQDDKIPATAGAKGAGLFIVDLFARVDHLFKPRGQRTGFQKVERNGFLGIRSLRSMGSVLFGRIRGKVFPIDQLQGHFCFGFRERRIIVRAAVKRFLLVIINVTGLSGHDAGEKSVDGFRYREAGAEVFREKGKRRKMLAVIAGKGVLFFDKDRRVRTSEAVDALLQVADIEKVFTIFTDAAEDHIL